jgi:acyl carrier protein
VNNLNLVLALEEQFQVQFDPEDFERMHTIGEVITVLEQRLA